MREDSYSEFKNTLDELDQEIFTLKKNKITVGPLNDTVDRLRSHTENVEKVERIVEEIREEIISPVKKDFKETERFSKIGLWVGALGLVVSITSIFLTIVYDYTGVFETDKDKRLIEQNKIIAQFSEQFSVMEYNLSRFNDRYDVLFADFQELEEFKDKIVEERSKTVSEVSVLNYNFQITSYELKSKTKLVVKINNNGSKRLLGPIYGCILVDDPSTFHMPNDIRFENAERGRPLELKSNESKEIVIQFKNKEIGSFQHLTLYLGNLEGNIVKFENLSKDDVNRDGIKLSYGWF